MQKRSTLRRKLKSSRGTTMVEMLAAVAILILLSVILSSGLNLVLSAYHRMTSRAETRLLLSTAADALTHELRYARSVETSGGVLKRYQSDSYGYNAMLMIGDEEENSGELIVRTLNGDYRMLATGVYGKNGIYRLSLGSEENPDSGQIHYDEETGVFTFTLTASEGGDAESGGETISSASAEFKVLCLNHQPG